MKRRDFIKHTSHAIAIPTILGSLGLNNVLARTMRSVMNSAMELDRALVIIYLDGGNDGLNTVVPLDALSVLNTVRPHVVLPEASLLNLENTEVGLHPSLTGLENLYKENKLAIVQSVGYPEQNFSHFRSKDIWMSGSNSNDYLSTGWCGRYLDTEYLDFPDAYPTTDMPDPLAIEIGYGSSLLFQGQNTSMSMVLTQVEDFYKLLDGVDDQAPDTNAGDRLEYVRMIARQSQQYGQVVKTAASKVTSQTEFPSSQLGQQLKIVSRLIAGGLKTPIYLVRITDFDTHSSQVDGNDTTTGIHADLLKDLDDSITSFMSDLKKQGTEDKVLGMTFSEFGRRITSNASLGTDHGSAAPMFLFGNHVNGGIYGNNPSIFSDATVADNLDTQYDYRQVYGSVLEQWFGINSSQFSDTLMGEYETLPLIDGGFTQDDDDTSDDTTDDSTDDNTDDSTEETEEESKEVLRVKKALRESLKVSPNPVQDHANISFYGNGGQVTIRLIDSNGKVVDRVYRGNCHRGMNNIPWSASKYPFGRYILWVESESATAMFNVIKL